MLHQNIQSLIEMTSNIIYIVAFGVGFKCPRKIHLDTQWRGYASSEKTIHIERLLYYIYNMNFLFKVHTYLFYTIVACMFTSVFEMIYINDVRPALARAAFTLLQGTWFYQVCNHPWLLRVFGFRFISVYNSYIIIWSFGRNMLF